MKNIVLITVIMFCTTVSSFGQKLIYTSPRNKAILVSLHTKIILKFNEKIEAQSLQEKPIIVTENKNKYISGKIKLLNDEKTIIFSPAQNFEPDEIVTVKINSNLKTIDGQSIQASSFQFNTTRLSKPIKLNPLSFIKDDIQKYTAGIKPIKASFPKKIDLSSLPEDFPQLTVDTSNNPSSGKIFLANFPYGANDSLGYYLMIVNNDGTVDRYKKLSQPSFDFKVEPNGDLSYAKVLVNYTEYAKVRWIILDSTLTQIDSFQCGNGYSADLHDFELLPNGHALLMAYDPEPFDMSRIVKGGDPNATVIGGIIQEVDDSDNVVFQWRSWDYIPITDSYQNLTTSTVDYLHMNAIDLDNDGNILASFRHLSQVIKINRQTGDVMWKLGGKENQFTFINENESNAPNYFSYQHDVRCLLNGDITLFDNGNQHNPPYSRAVEYKLDEKNKTATLVWEYRHNPDIYAFAMGTVQRLSNGNTLIGWGIASATGAPVFTEVHPDNSIALEMSYPAGELSYRAYKFPWVSNQPKSSITEYEFFQGNTYSFNQANDSTGVTIKFDSLNAYPYPNATISAYDYAPDHPEFKGTPPLLISEYFNLGEQSINSFKGEFHINLSEYPNIINPGKTIAYSRSSDSLVFHPLPTSFDSSKNELIFLGSDFGDYAFGVPQKIDSAYSPVPLSPVNGKMLNNQKPVKLVWGTRGIVSTYTVQISTDSLFNNIIVNESGLSSTSYSTPSLSSNKYFWRVNTQNQVGVSNWSNPANFITTAPFIKVTFPEGGESLTNDSTYIIRWDCNISDSVRIELLKDNAIISVIDSSLISNTNAYQWNVPSTLAPDSTYKIEIVCLNNPTLVASSKYDFNIISSISGISSNPAIIKGYELYQNFPNPFNPSTVIKYSIPKASNVKILIYNTVGQKVETLVNKYQNQGTYEVNWNAANMSSGIYFYSIKANGVNGKRFFSVKKMILLK